MQVIEQLRSMPIERFTAIYESLGSNGFGPLDGEVAKALKFRPQAIRKLPMAQRAKRAKNLLERDGNAELCYELFGTYLMASHKQLVLDFLDLTGVEHKDGMIQNVEESRPDPAKLSEAIQGLDDKYDAPDVTLYLSMCAEQWPSVPEIDSLWRMRV